jgi:tetratricopeptide (TPR) repeat protein
MKAGKGRSVAVQSSASRSLKTGWRVTLAALALCGVTALAYSNSFQAGFALDNKTLLLHDERIREATPRNLALIFQHTYWWPYGESGLYRPVTTLSYLFNYATLGNGDRPAGYHWINLALHLGNVLLCYAVARRLIRHFWPAFFVAALWALHPVSTEAVTNIAGRPDLLAAMAVLSGFLIYLKSREAGGTGQARRPIPLGWLAALSVVTIVGVLSKESAVTLPGVVLLYELVWWRGRQRLPLLEWLAILLPLLATWRLRAAVLSGAGAVEFPFWDNPLTRAGFWTARLTAVKIMPRYLWLTVWPQKLSCDYSYRQISLARGSIEDCLAWLVMAAAVAAMAVLFRRNRVAFFFAGFAFVAFLPTANLLFPIGTIMAERFLYLPSVGLIACLVLALYGAGRSARRAAPIVLCLMAAGFCMRTWARNLDWHDDLTMAAAAVQTSPDSFKTHYLLAQALYESDPSHSQLDREINEAEASLAILDTLPDSLNYAAPYQWGGECYLLKGDLLRGTPESPWQAGSAPVAQRPASKERPHGRSVLPESEYAYRRSLQILLRCVSINKGRPAAGLYQALSTAYLRLADTQKALEAAAYASQLDPLKSEPYRQVAEVLVAAGRAEEAAVKLVEGVILTGDSSLGDELLGLYRSGLDPKGCATVSGSGGPALNPGCDTVRRHFCAAAAETMRVDLQIARPAHAVETRNAAVQRFNCPAGPLNEILRK